MNLEKKVKKLSNVEKIERYRPVEVAVQYEQQENTVAADEALKTLKDTMKMDNEELIKYMNSAEKITGQGRQLMYEAYIPEYRAALMDSNIGELFKHYSSNFKKYINEATIKRMQAVFKEYSNLKYKDIHNKVKEFEGIKNSERTDIDDKQRKKADEELKKYNKIFIPLKMFESIEMKKISGPIDEGFIEKTIDSLFPDEEKDKTEGAQGFAKAA